MTSQILTSHKRGKHAEATAADLLINNGLTILCRNYRSKAGEIDLIAYNQVRLAFVEVKYRKKAADTCWAISARQQLRLIAGAEDWLSNQPNSTRELTTFDVVFLSSDAEPKYLIDAFRPS